MRDELLSRPVEVRVHLHGGALTITGGKISGVEITACWLGNEMDLPTPPIASTDQWTYMIALDYQINHRVPLPSSLS